MVDEFPKSALDKFRQWHFWWLVVFSFLLIITFVYYLPTRFLQQVGTEAPHGHEGENGMMMTDEEMHQHTDEHMTGGMSMNEMMEHMMTEHSMAEHDAQHMMEDMMSHEHEGETDHEHASPTPGQAGDEHATEEHGESAYHEEADVKEGLAVNLNISPVPYNIGVPLSLDFFVNTKPGNIPVLANQLQIEHTKLMHVVGLRSDMNEFFHIHPDFLADNPSIFSVEYTFKKPGLYKMWSSVKKDGVDHTFGHPEVNINGAGLKEEKKISFGRNVIASNYQVSLISSDTIARNREVELSFDIHSLNGQEINVEDYLGAQMHLVLIKDDWKQFIHTHPVGSHAHAKGVSPVDLKEATSNGTSPAGIISVALADEGHEQTTNGTSSGGDEVISFAVTFPEAGLYKAFAQFRPQRAELPADEAITAEFWLQVEEKAPFPVSQWWGLLLVSALLIAGLSWVVKKYLVVKAEDVTVKK